MENRIKQLFRQKQRGILSVYFTAGFPYPDATVPVIEALTAAGADLIEVGMPFSDPIADGPTIQASNQQALDQGMTIPRLFDQLTDIRQRTDVPLILMGYLNPVWQYGVERFCARCEQIGIDGLILPDLPLAEYADTYRALFRSYGLFNIFLITPQTPEARIRRIDELSEGFIYVVSSASVTGAKRGVTDAQVAYFERIRALQLRNPTLIGFGISDRASFEAASQHAAGAIVGSAFINVLREAKDLPTAITDFVEGLRSADVSSSQ